MLKEIIDNLGEFESAVISAQDFIEVYAEDGNDGEHHEGELSECLTKLYRDIESLETLAALLERADTALAEGALAAGEAGAIDAQEQIAGVRTALAVYAAAPGDEKEE